jgi:protein-S-isoprenylcysteine O-methyltransferase Ste14
VNARVILNIAMVAWPVSEIVLGIVRKSRQSTSAEKDRGSVMLLWGVIAISSFAAVALRLSSVGRMSIPATPLVIIALVLLGGGLVIRWIAIVTLGRFFTTTVAISADHRIIRDGLYSVVRHPSYTGLLLAFLGLGFAFGNWLSLAALMVPVTAALLHRIRIEETALHEAFGQEYAAYMKETARLVPGIF